MKTYCYYEPDVDSVIFVTEQEIINEFWGLWCKVMEERYGVDSERITLDECIMDWCCMNSANEVVE